MAIAALILAALAGLIAHALKMRPILAWLIGCVVVPCFILIAEFALPYQGGGASMWPIAIIFGGAYGAIASAVGVFIGKLIFRGESGNA